MQSGRWVRVRWANQADQPFDTVLELECVTRDGLVLDTALALSTAHIRVKELGGKDLPGGKSFITIRFEVKNVSELDAVRNKLMGIPDVISVRRGQN